MEKLILKEAQIYKISHSIFEKQVFDISSIDNEITKTITEIKEKINIWKNITVKLDNTNINNISILEKNTYKEPIIHINLESVKKYSDKLNIPNELIISNCIYFCLGKSLLELDIKEKYFLLDSGDSDVYCEQFAYNMYYLNFKITEDLNNLIVKINEERDLFMPLNTTIGLQLPSDDVMSQFGNLGGNKPRNKPDFKSIKEDEFGNFYTEDDIYYLIQKYKIWCLQNNQTPMDDALINGRYITYIKNLLNN